MPVEFVCEHQNPVRPTEPFTTDQCRVCWRKAGGQDNPSGDVSPAPPPDAPCPYEGGELSGAERNAAGLGHGRRWLYCLHPDKPLGPYVCRCQGCGPRCPGHPKSSTAPRRHLLCHVYPRAGNGVWRRAVDQVRRRLPLFTGKTVFAVVTGGSDLDPAPAVRAYLPAGALMVEVPNDPKLREVATWGPLWDAVTPYLGPADAVLYAHAKGVTRPVDPGNSCQWWASLLWPLVLDHWPLVERLLKTYPIVGPFKKVGHGFGPGFGDWHYSGTFYWMSVKDFLTRRRAVPVPRRWWGVEAWPGVAYPVAEAGCLFHEGRQPFPNLYSPRYWMTTVRPEYERWMKENPPAWPWLTASTPSGGG